MRFGLLGSLLVVDDAGREVRIAAPRQRVLLASLLVRANHTVPVDELTEIVWDGEPPTAAQKTLRSYVMRLRQVVGPTVAARIRTRDPGYRCEVTEDELDVLAFEARCRDTAAALRAGEWARASAQAAAALRWWRDAPLLDVPAQALHADFVPRYEQLRLQVLEDRAEAELRLGQHDRLVPELRELTARYPMRERFHGQLMRALARAGRRAEALAVYRTARGVLVDELGVEPGPELQAVLTRILAGDKEPVAPVRAREHVPRQLPAGIGHFSGRVDALKALSERAAGTGTAVVISAIDGTAGIGKTALAVHWGRQVADAFPDGQLYVNLRGFDPGGQPMPPAAAVRGFLDALDVPVARIPVGLEAQVGLYRSLLAERRMLVVLDNARDADQVRPLLPGSAGCLVLVTSRDQLAGLVAVEGAHPLTVDLLSEADAHDLLAHRLGADRVAREPAAVAELIDLCARLPLALNIAAARAALRPGYPLAMLAEELRDARLTLLETGDTQASVRAAFGWSYRALDPATARMFRLLATHPGPDITVAAAASLAGTSRDQARGALHELARANLLTEHSPGRHGCHDLLRTFAAERSDIEDTDADRQAARHRILDHYLHTTYTADRLFYPTRDPIDLTPAGPGVTPERLADRDHGVRWFEAEHPVLLAVIDMAARTGFDVYAWQLPWTLATMLPWSGRWHDLATTQHIARTAAQRLGDRTQQATAERGLGSAYLRLGEYADAEAHLHRALELYGATDDHDGLGRTHLLCASVLGEQGRHREALTHAGHALAEHTAAGHLVGRAAALNSIGWNHTLLGDHEQALVFCEQALELHQRAGNRPSEAATLDSIGHAQHELGRHTEAVATFQRAMDLLTAMGDRFHQTKVLTNLGETHRVTGDIAAARQAWQRALDILTDLDHPDATQIHAKLRALDNEPVCPHR